MCNKGFMNVTLNCQIKPGNPGSNDTGIGYRAIVASVAIGRCFSHDSHAILSQSLLDKRQETNGVL